MVRIDGRRFQRIWESRRRMGFLALMLFLLGCGSFLPTPTPHPAVILTFTATPWPTQVMHYTPTPTLTPAPTPTPLVYEIQKGDTLLAIAIRLGVDVDEIMEANGIESAHRLRVGQKLTIPRPDVTRPTRTPTPTATITPVVSPVAVTHVVRGGETWEIIARHYFVTVEALLKANPDIDPEGLQAGDELIVPVESGL